MDLHFSTTGPAQTRPVNREKNIWVRIRLDNDSRYLYNKDYTCKLTLMCYVNSEVSLSFQSSLLSINLGSGDYISYMILWKSRLIHCPLSIVHWRVVFSLTLSDSLSCLHPFRSELFLVLRLRSFTLAHP